MDLRQCERRSAVTGFRTDPVGNIYRESMDTLARFPEDCVYAPTYYSEQDIASTT
jgi:hypothetical protein